MWQVICDALYDLTRIGKRYGPVNIRDWWSSVWHELKLRQQ